MDEEGVVYIYTVEYYSALQKNAILPFAVTWMELENTMLSESVIRERQIPYGFSHVEFKKQKNEQRGKEERDKSRKRLLIVLNKLKERGVWG